MSSTSFFRNISLFSVRRWAGLAEVVFTGDRDTLDVAETLPVTAVCPQGFWEMLHGRT